MTTPKGGPPVDTVEREFPPIGKYRVRLLHDTKKPDGPKLLDIREYVSGEKFEGFTRRGVRISLEQARMLLDTLDELLGTKKTS